MSSLTFEGTDIKSNDDGLVCLTDMWKASGKDENYKPQKWARFAGSQIIKHLDSEQKDKGMTDPLMETRRGKGGGTYAVKKLALAYAEYLSPAMLTAAQALATVALIDTPEAQGWKAVAVAKSVTKLLPSVR